MGFPDNRSSLKSPCFPMDAILFFFLFLMFCPMKKKVLGRRNGSHYKCNSKTELCAAERSDSLLPAICLKYACSSYGFPLQTGVLMSDCVKYSH